MKVERRRPAIGRQSNAAIGARNVVFLTVDFNCDFVIFITIEVVQRPMLEARSHGAAKHLIFAAVRNRIIGTLTVCPDMHRGGI